MPLYGGYRPDLFVWRKGRKSRIKRGDAASPTYAFGKKGHSMSRWRSKAIEENRCASDLRHSGARLQASNNSEEFSGQVKKLYS